MNDFKNKFYIDFLLLALTIFVGVLMTNEYGNEASVLGALMLILCGTFAITTSNLINIFRKKEEIISKSKQKSYIKISLLIIIGVLIFDINQVPLLLILPVCISISAVLNSIIFKE